VDGGLDGNPLMSREHLDAPGVPLFKYDDGKGGYGVRFACRACMSSHDEPLARVIERLRVTGLGDEKTGIRAVAKFARRPCRRCGALKWETEPAMGPRPARRLAPLS